jgi:hypothetical protein
MVLATEKPSLRLASCCSVEVVNGGAGDFFAGLVSMSATEKSAGMHFSRKAFSHPGFLIFQVSSALN